MASQTEENYLKSLLMLTGSTKGVNASELSTLLKVSLPTVNSMVKNLKKQGLVNYERYKPVSLTRKGKKEAALVLRKHRLTEMYLVEKMGFGWEEVHDIAELDLSYAPPYAPVWDPVLIAANEAAKKLQRS